MHQGHEHVAYASRFLGRRRLLLRAGGLGCLGLGLPGLFRAEAAPAGQRVGARPLAPVRA
jgi:hypothetical protein